MTNLSDISILEKKRIEKFRNVRPEGDWIVHWWERDDLFHCLKQLYTELPTRLTPTMAELLGRMEPCVPEVLCNTPGNPDSVP